MTGERALNAVIAIFFIAAVLVALPIFLLMANADNIPDFPRTFIAGLIQPLWFAVPAVFLMRGSQIARWVAVFISLMGLVVAFMFASGLADGGVATHWAHLFAAPVYLVFAFSLWALCFYSPLKAALDQRAERRKAIEKARLRKFYEEMGEPFED
jgi:hypothetical protein